MLQRHMTHTLYTSNLNNINTSEPNTTHWADEKNKQ